MGKSKHYITLPSRIQSFYVQLSYSMTRCVRQSTILHTTGSLLFVDMIESLGCKHLITHQGSTRPCILSTVLIACGGHITSEAARQALNAPFLCTGPLRNVLTRV